MATREIRSGADYQWVQRMCNGKTAHAITPRLTSTDVSTYVVCGKTLPTMGIVAQFPATSRCQSCLQGIKNGTGWA